MQSGTLRLLPSTAAFRLITREPEADTNAERPIPKPKITFVPSVLQWLSFLFFREDFRFVLVLVVVLVLEWRS
jgi:hypothetical protein